ncbi:hypothetical protein KVT40_000259 [Elsinoe batatas]|uniref:Uncharacterized protein n=1 Tax=Elsinoe batatas TaxID=2601811 RepID=A0A8K0L9S7_9PEZI|nr:hypothetical protein KVT40_000259 [Elsinoe batatas]
MTRIPYQRTTDLRGNSSLVIYAGILPTTQALLELEKLPVASSTPSHVGQVPTPAHSTMRLLVYSASFQDHSLKSTLFILDTIK